MKQNLFLILTATLSGANRLYLQPVDGLDVSLINDATLKEILGDISNDILKSTPATDSVEEDALVGLTERTLTAALDMGYTPPEGAATDTVENWNILATDFSQWLATDETPAETVTAEQVTEPITNAEATEIVAEATETVEGEAVVAEIVAVAKEITGVQLSPAAALGVLTAQNVAKATKASQQINAALLVRAEEAFKALKDVLEMGGANAEILSRLSEHAQATLPETVEVA